MYYGYVRVSSAEQNETRQVLKMQQLGIERKNIYIDKTSGKDLNRKAYQELMSVVQKYDTIYIDSLDRLGRKYEDIITEWKRLTRDVGVDIICLDLDFFNSKKFHDMGAMGVCVEDMLLALLAYVAQTERIKIKQRQAEGIAIARAAGKYKNCGRKKLHFEPDKLAQAQACLDSGGTLTQASKLLGVSYKSVYRLIDRGLIKHKKRR